MSFTSRRSKSAIRSINDSDMTHEVSAFYPPRARWYSPLLSASARLRRRLAMDHIHLPSGVSPGGSLASVLFPGVAFYVCGLRLWGKIALASSAILLFLNVLWFGSRAANLAFGLLLSLHASGLGFLLEKMLPAPRLRTKLILAAALLALLACGLYLPARTFVQNRWFLPLRLKGQLIIVRRESPPGTLRRGDVIAYSFEGVNWPGIIVHAGYGLGPVLALPGDRVRFTQTTFEVNGQAQPRLGLMPQSGEVTVSERHWFVWPNFDMYGHGNVVDKVPETLLNLGMVSEREFLGRPCHRWLWHQQL